MTSSLCLLSLDREEQLSHQAACLMTFMISHSCFCLALDVSTADDQSSDIAGECGRDLYARLSGEQGHQAALYAQVENILEQVMDPDHFTGDA
jgi:hypothetical protein